MILRHKWLILSGIILTAAVVYYLSCTVSAVNKTVKDFNKAYFESLPQKENDTINQCEIPGYIDKIRKKAYLGAQVKMATTDSVGLSINMRDSVISLLIKGVEVKRMKIRASIVSPFFHRANQEAVYSALSAPLVVTSSEATFRKDPMQRKIAPKDTIEAEANMEEKPDTTDFEAVYFTLNTDKNIRLFFQQMEDTLSSDRKARFYFDLDDRLEGAKADIKAITNFETPPYTPFIKIWVPKAEAKVIYYAIPREGLIVLTL